jgi:hypothetical protein
MRVVCGERTQNGANNGKEATHASTFEGAAVDTQFVLPQQYVANNFVLFIHVHA